MEGWAFAAAALAVVLAFEFVLFRYFTPDRPTRRFDGASETPDAGANAGRSGSPGGPADRARTTGDRGPAPGDARIGCPECGAANADAPTVVFCRSCLARLR